MPCKKEMTDIIPAVVSAEEMRSIDDLMEFEFGIELSQMMEMAGRNLADLALKIIGSGKKLDSLKIVVAAGKGHNGGGGLTAARYLSNRGVNVSVILAGGESEKLKPAVLKRLYTLKKLPVQLINSKGGIPPAIFKEADLIIDALVGYGLKGNMRGESARIIKEINKSGNSRILALDVPSGLNSTDGSVGKLCIKARTTLTLALPKTGLIISPGREKAGQLYLADIGVPPELYKKIGLQPQDLFKEESIILLNN
ncbi:MAG: NAD(P)H-hydrate epimerase [Candidatus Neomarinimicrobiota bacterium]